MGEGLWMLPKMGTSWLCWVNLNQRASVGQKFLSLTTKMASISSAGSGGPLGILGSQFNSPQESPECSSCKTNPVTKRPTVRSLWVKN